VPFSIAAIVILVGIIGILLWSLYRRPTAKPQMIYAIPPETTIALTVKDQTIAELSKSLETAQRENGEALDRMVKKAEEEIETRVAAARAELVAEFQEHKRTDRQVSNRLSRGALLAKVMEHIGPLVPGFPYPLKECRHIGEIFDYLVFDGLESGGEISVVFLEVKTTSTGRTRRVTNPREKALRDAIRKGRVRYEVWQPPTDDQLTEKLEKMIEANVDKAIAPPLDTQPADG
jgi:predicted Holliday junction resolvase-like endonuclease